MTGYETQFYKNIAEINRSMKTIAESLSSANLNKEAPDHEKDTYKLGECIFDLTSVYFDMRDAGILKTDIDSREIYAEIYELARNFEKEHSDHEWNEKDYMSEISKAGSQDFIDKYGGINLKS